MNPLKYLVMPSAIARLTLAGVMLAFLASCGTIYSYTSGEDASAQAAEAASSSIKLRDIWSQRNPFRRAPELPNPRDILTPDVLSRATTPLLLMEYEDRFGWALFQPIANNDTVLTWLSDSGQSLSFDEEGVLQASRGLGRDLISADGEAMSQFLKSRANSASRVLRVQDFLDGENQVLRQAYVCSVQDAGVAPRKLLNATVRLQELQEICFGPEGEAFTNLYWRDPATGFLRGSTQWISPDIGRVRLEVVAQ